MKEDLENLTVEFYSGGSRDERPTALCLKGRRWPILRVIREERIGSADPEEGYRRIFFVESEDHAVWKLQEDRTRSSGWEIRRMMAVDES